MGAQPVIEARRLYKLGIGLTGAHLMAAVLINSSPLLTLLRTRVKRLSTCRGVRVTTEPTSPSLALSRLDALGGRDAEMENFIHFSHEVAS